MIVTDLIEAVKEKAEGKRIKDLRVGLGYTAVLLDDDKCGLAYTFRNELGPCCCVCSEGGKIKEKKTIDIIQWAMSDNLVKSSIGIATINALLQDNVKEYNCSNVFEVLDIGAKDTLGVIGDFKPLTKGKGKKAKKLYVFERRESREDNYYSSNMINEYLPKCDIVVITSTSIINKTFDEIVKYCTKARQVAMVGPTTPLCPKVFKKYKIDILAGVLIEKPLKVLEIVSEGGGTKNFNDSVKQIYLEKLE